MDDPRILDAPDEEHTPGEISFTLPFVITIGLVVPFTFLFYLLGQTFYISSFIGGNMIRISDKEYGIIVSAFIGLFIFHSMVKNTDTSKLKLMIISGFIVFFALILAATIALITFNQYERLGLFEGLSYSLQVIIPLALLAGCCFSLAIQFFLRKKYFLFLIIVIPTLVLFSLVG